MKKLMFNGYSNFTKNASNAQNMIKEVIKTFKDFSVDKDPANNCLDVAIITDQN